MFSYTLTVSDWTVVHIFLNLECNKRNKFQTSGQNYLKCRNTFSFNFMQVKTKKKSQLKIYQVKTSFIPLLS